MGNTKQVFSDTSSNAMENCCSGSETQGAYREMVDRIVSLSGWLVDYIMDTDIDWTETILGALFIAHILFLVLFFCSRSLIAATFRE